MTRMLDGADDLRAAEADLRWLVRDVLTRALGPDWLESSGLSQGRLAAARAAAEADKARLGGPSNDLLAYTQLWDLETIIVKNWQKFASILGDKKEFEVLLGRLAKYRNPQAHGRALLPYEWLLASGIAGEIRSRVTIYRSSADVNGSYYPQIERVSDSLGRVWTPDMGRLGVLGYLAIQVGQRVTFSCQAWDPQGRELSWRLERELVGRELFDSATGTEVELSFAPEERHVSEGFGVAIVMHSDGKYHRQATGADDVVSFYFDVLPPE